MSDVQDRLKYMVVDEGVSLREISKLTGIPKTTIGRLWRGEAPWTPERERLVRDIYRSVVYERLHEVEKVPRRAAERMSSDPPYLIRAYQQEAKKLREGVLRQAGIDYAIRKEVEARDLKGDERARFYMRARADRRLQESLVRKYPMPSKIQESVLDNLSISEKDWDILLDIYV